MPAAPPESTSSLERLTAAAKLLGFALSARALLLLALAGAFVLAVMAMQAQSLASLEVLTVYGIFAVLPVAYLEIKRRAA